MSDKLFSKIYENSRRDYNVKYAKGDVDLEDIQEAPEFRKGNGNIQGPVDGLPNFEYNDGGYGPIPTTGVGRRDYNAKYSKTGNLVESFERIYEETCDEEECDDDGAPPQVANLDESFPTHTKSGKLIEQRVPKGTVSPALRESVERQRLIESGLIDKEDLDLLNEDFEDGPSIMLDEDDWDYDEYEDDPDAFGLEGPTHEIGEDGIDPFDDDDDYELETTDMDVSLDDEDYEAETDEEFDDDYEVEDGPYLFDEMNDEDIYDEEDDF